MPLNLLLNWRIWASVGFVVFQAWFGYTMYKKGQENVQVEFDMYKNQQILNALNAENVARAKERVLQSTNDKVTKDYENLKTATAVAVSALDADRMRLQSTLAASHSTAPKDSSTGAGIIESPEDGVLTECLARYEEVAGDADALSNQVKALQDYINKVVLK